QQLHARRSPASSGPLGRQVRGVHHFHSRLRLVVALVDLLGVAAKAFLALLAQIARLDQHFLATAVGIVARAALVDEVVADLLFARLHRDILAVEVPGAELPLEIADQIHGAATVVVAGAVIGRDTDALRYALVVD